MQPLLILANVFYTQIMETEIVFTELLLRLWNDKISDEKHEEICTLSSSLIERKTKVFEPLLFSSNSVEDHVKNSKITGALAETGHLQLRIAPQATHLNLFIVA